MRLSARRSPPKSIVFPAVVLVAGGAVARTDKANQVGNVQPLAVVFYVETQVDDHLLVRLRVVVLEQET